jgi:hypothetical protein
MRAAVRYTGCLVRKELADAAAGICTDRFDDA